jgi:flagellar M-ring protein FliF
MADAPPTPPPAGAAAVLAQARQLWERQPRRRKGLAALAVAGAIAVVGAARLASTAEPWSVVAAQGSPDDVQELVSALAARDIAARVRDGKVEVAADQVVQARAIAAAAGLPRTGTGLELFDRSTLGQSSFTEQVNFRRALQGELARSITALAQVQGARVHLALGRRSVFKEQQEPASASVALHLHAGQSLTAEQVRGVRQLVAASIDGLRPDAVVVVDNRGNLLDAPEPGSTDRRAEIERTLAARVRAILERVVGVGKVSVAATAVVDDRQVSETQELFDGQTPAVRSESRTVEGTDPGAGGIGGVAGARGNLPGAPVAGPVGPADPNAPGAGSAAAAPRRLQETKNYEVSRTVRQTTKPAVLLQKVHLAVVIDYKTDAEGKPAARTAEELAELTALARQAAGIDDARGDKLEVRSIPFAPDADHLAGAAAAGPAGLQPLHLAIAGGAILVLAIAALAIFARRRRRARAEREASTVALALPAPVAELERAIDANAAGGDLAAPAEPAGLPPGKPVRDRVLDAVRGDLDRAAEVLTSWLAEPAPGASAAAAAPAKGKDARP